MEQGPLKEEDDRQSGEGSFSNDIEMDSPTTDIQFLQNFSLFHSPSAHKMPIINILKKSKDPDLSPTRSSYVGKRSDSVYSRKSE